MTFILNTNTSLKGRLRNTILTNTHSPTHTHTDSSMHQLVPLQFGDVESSARVSESVVELFIELQS